MRQLKAFSARVSPVIKEVGPDLIYAEGPLVEDYLVRPPIKSVPVVFHPHGLEMFQRDGVQVYGRASAAYAIVGSQPRNEGTKDT